MSKKEDRLASLPDGIHEGLIDELWSCEGVEEFFHKYEADGINKRIAGVPFIDYHLYKSMEAHNEICSAVLLVKKKVQGILILAKEFHTHYNEIIAEIDSLYVVPEYRAAWGRKMLACAEFAARRWGAKALVLNAKYDDEKTNRLFSFYAEPASISYWKTL